MDEISELKALWEGFDFTYLFSIVQGLIPSLICVTIHELSHGYTALCLGDATARRMGRLSLNPLKHLDIMGFIMLLVFRFGWAKPVPVNSRNFKNPKRGMAITALAGPVSNVLLSAVVLFIYGLLFLPLRKSEFGVYVLEMLQITALMSIGLGVFNIIPVPPLDGSKVVFSLLKDTVYYKLLRYERYGTLLMLVLVWTGILGRPLSMIVGFAFDRLFFLAQLGFDIAVKLF